MAYGARDESVYDDLADEGKPTQTESERLASARRSRVSKRTGEEFEVTSRHSSSDEEDRKVPFSVAPPSAPKKGGLGQAFGTPPQENSDEQKRGGLGGGLGGGYNAGPPPVFGGGIGGGLGAPMGGGPQWGAQSEEAAPSADA